MKNLLLRSVLAGLAATSLFSPLYAGQAESETVSAFLDAYNEHDSNKMLQFAASDVRWMSIADNKITVESEGKKALAAYMDGYFESMPSTRSEPRDIQSVGNFVSMIEEAQWQRDDKAQSRCAMAVYEIKEGLIRNVWYFKGQPCEDSSTAAP